MFFLESSEFTCQKLPNKTLYPDENSVKSMFKQAAEEEQIEVESCNNERLKRNRWRKINWRFININQSFAILAGENFLCFMLKI